MQLVKKFGQHLLESKKILKFIANAVSCRDLNVLEIGPGTGNLTRQLLKQKPNCLLSYEIDVKMVKLLQDTFKSEMESKKLVVVHKDFSMLVPHEFPKFDVCIANIPYQISSKILFKLLQFPIQYQSAVLLVQDEFATRLTARTNEKDYSRLSVNTALLASVESLMDVPPECFNPPPKVNSRVIKIVPQTVPVMENGKPIKMQELDSMLRICFSRKNKTIKAMLTSKEAMKHMLFTDSSLVEYKQKTDHITKNVIFAHGFQKARAIKMSPSEYVKLYDIFQQCGISFIPIASRDNDALQKHENFIKEQA